MSITMTINIVWRVKSSQIEENKPPKIVIIMTTEPFKSKEFSSSVINGFRLTWIQKHKHVKIKIKNPLFWYKICPEPTFANEIIKIIAIFFSKKKKSLLYFNKFYQNFKQKSYTNKTYLGNIHSKGIQLCKWLLYWI